jgi:hypothetical protein
MRLAGSSSVDEVIAEARGFNSVREMRDFFEAREARAARANTADVELSRDAEASVNSALEVLKGL